jgi:uncharacterized protein DUF4136
MRRALASGLLLAWVALAGVGCATDVRVDFDPGEDFSSYRTWDWLRPSWQGNPLVSGVDRGLESLVRLSIESGLRARGYERSSVGQPDFLVAYHLTLERELVRRLETPAMQTLSSPHREGGFEVTASRPTLQLYETGTLVVVVANAGDLQRVWRGIGIRRVRDSFKTRAERVVSDLVSRFPAVSASF